MAKPTEFRDRAQDKHYCRLCPADFLTIYHIEYGTLESESYVRPAHRQAMIHKAVAHGIQDTVELPRRCSRSCSEVEQPEEAKAGRRLYGPGVERRPTGKSPEEIERLTDMMGYEER